MSSKVPPPTDANATRNEKGLTCPRTLHSAGVMVQMFHGPIPSASRAAGRFLPSREQESRCGAGLGIALVIDAPHVDAVDCSPTDVTRDEDCFIFAGLWHDRRRCPRLCHERDVARRPVVPRPQRIPARHHGDPQRRGADTSCGKSSGASSPTAATFTRSCERMSWTGCGNSRAT